MDTKATFEQRLEFQSFLERTSQGVVWDVDDATFEKLREEAMMERYVDYFEDEQVDSLLRER